MASRAMLTLVDGEETPHHIAHRVLLRASLETLGGVQAATIRGLSTTRAFIEGAALPRSGTHVLLRFRTLEVSGEVIRVTDHSCEIVFDEALHEADLLSTFRSKPAGASSTTLLHKRPGFRTRPLTAEEWKIVEDWARPHGRAARA